MQHLTEPVLEPTHPDPPSPLRRARRWPLVAISVVLAVVAAFLLGRAVGGDDDADQGGELVDAAALVDEGLQLHVEGDLAGAAQRYRQAIASDDTNVLAHYNLGLVHQMDGRTADATTEYERTIALDPAYAPALFNLGVLAAADADAERAVDLYRRAIAADPGFASAQFNLGLLLLEAGDVEAGNVAVQAAIALDPTLAERLESPPD